MRKLFLLFMCCLCLCGCEKEKSNSNTQNTTKDEDKLNGSYKCSKYDLSSGSSYTITLTINNNLLLTKVFSTVEVCQDDSISQGCENIEYWEKDCSYRDTNKCTIEKTLNDDRTLNINIVKLDKSKTIQMIETTNYSDSPTQYEDIINNYEDEGYNCTFNSTD